MMQNGTIKYRRHCSYCTAKSSKIN